MKGVFAFFTSYSKKENKSTRTRTNRAGSNTTTVQSQSRSSLETHYSAENESFMSRITGRRAFSFSTPHLPNALAREPPGPAFPRKPLAFRRPRFYMFRDTSLAPAPSALQSSCHPGAHEAPPPDFTHATSPQSAIPPMQPLPCTFVQTRPIYTPDHTVSRPPRGPLPVPPVTRSRAEAHAVLQGVARVGPGTRHRSRSVTSGSGSSTRTVPALDDVWKDFVRDVAGDIPSMSRLHSYDVSSKTRRDPPTRPLPGLPVEVPSIVASRRPEPPPAIGSGDIRTPNTLTPRPSLDSMHHSVPSLPSGSFTVSCEPSIPPGLDPTLCPSQDAIQHLAPSLASGSSLAAASYYHFPGKCTSPPVDRSISCSSSEISLSLFPLPPTRSNATPFTSCHATVNATTPQPRTLPLSVPPPLEDHRGSFDSSDPEVPISPVDTKFPPFPKFYPLKTQTSMDSVSTVTTAEWSEISLSYSPSNEDLELRGAWNDSQTVESSCGYGGGIMLCDEVNRVGEIHRFMH